MLGAGVGIADNLRRLEDQIGTAALRVGRRPDEITLVGVSKTHPAESVVEAIGAGLRHVGENRVQEAAAKFPVVRQLLAAGSEHQTEAQTSVFHMVGHLQTNKAAQAIGLFDRIDSVDSLHLAQALSRRAAGTTLPVLLEVYVGDDPRRPGLRPDELIDVAGQILEVTGPRVDGLMTVPPLGGDPRSAFRQLYALKLRLSEAFSRVHFGVLSMGMSEDFLLAIEEGSTEVRIGTALFGPRNPRR
jgi:PLP dependent protein